MLFSCYHHAMSDQDLPKVYLHSENAAHLRAWRLASVAASRAVLPRDAEDFEVVVEMRW
jgi:hypothetical protein